MLLTVDAGSDQPIHEQIAGQLRRAIATAELGRGDRLPPARELAGSLGVNVHTVLRGFNTLKDEGLLEVRRGRGTLVTGRAPEHAEFVTRARELVTEARRAGLSNTEILQAVEAQL